MPLITLTLPSDGDDITQDSNNTPLSQIAALLNGQLDQDNLANLGITAAKIANATITGAKIAAATITGANIAAATIGASNIQANTITGAQVADNSIYTGALTSNWASQAGSGMASFSTGVWLFTAASATLTLTRQQLVVVMADIALGGGSPAPTTNCDYRIWESTNSAVWGTQKRATKSAASGVTEIMGVNMFGFGVLPAGTYHFFPSVNIDNGAWGIGNWNIVAYALSAA